MTHRSLMTTVSIVIPTRDGARCLEELLPPLRALFRYSASIVEILIVDDGSDRDNRVRLDTLARRYREVVILRSASCSGQVHATLVGVARARGDIVVTMDDDGAHPPRVVSDMIALLCADSRIDLVYAAPRPVRNQNVHRNRWTVRHSVRRIGTAANNLHFRLFLGLPRGVPVGSFRAIRRDLLVRALNEPVRYHYLSAMLLRCNPGVGLVRYHRDLRSGGESPHGSSHGSPHGSRQEIHRLMGVLGRLVLYWGPLRPLGRLLRRRTRFNAHPERQTPDRWCAVVEHAGTENRQRKCTVRI